MDFVREEIIKLNNTMTNEQFRNIHLNQRVSQTIHFRTPTFETVTLFGYITKIYNGNHQAQVWFDGENKPRVVGKTQINIVKDNE